MEWDNQFCEVWFGINPLVIKFFCEPETVQFKKIKKSVLNTITFYVEIDNDEEVNFNGETLTFTLQLIKVWTSMFTYNFVSIRVCLFSHDWL